VVFAGTGSTVRTDTAILSLGANLGRREESVLRAVRELVHRGAVRVIALSGLYETAPVGMGEVPYFINCAAQVQPLLCPIDLLDRLQAVERHLGRIGGHNASRRIDIDIVAYGGVVQHAPRLTLPHPRYRQRAFVLIPLREIVPEFACPAGHTKIDQLIAHLPPGEGDGVVRVSGRGWRSAGEP